MVKSVPWLLLLAGLPLMSAGDPTPAIATGPAIGTRVPEFQALDQSNHKRSLTSVLGPSGSLLVFFRSADW